MGDQGVPWQPLPPLFPLPLPLPLAPRLATRSSWIASEASYSAYPALTAPSTTSTSSSLPSWTRAQWACDSSSTQTRSPA
eukprot:1091757-Pyramimonas_sp.AAC.1